MNYTSLEQSKKLVEMGLDPESASMRYDWDYNDHNYVGPNHIIIHNWDDPYNKAVPCWSVEDLLKVLPKSAPGSCKTSCWELLPTYKAGFCLSYITVSGTEIVAFYGESLIDICFDAMVWAIKRNKNC